MLTASVFDQEVAIDSSSDGSINRAFLSRRHDRAAFAAAAALVPASRPNTAPFMSPDPPG
jgi:hypothetical protein